jgi:[acyl-carrier-protein] S-malonyltransferase
MGKDLFENSELAKSLFKQANDSLGFDITRIMFEGEKEELTQTKVTQIAIFLHSIILAKVLGSQFKADMVAGHSLGEFSALVAANYMTFEDGLKLVYNRALAMQKACEQNPSTMAAILGLEDKIVEEVCQSINGVVVPANYNCPGQLVISGSNEAIAEACQKLTDAGARRALQLPVGGAFHSPLMEPAQIELAVAIENTPFKEGDCPIYQNVTAKAETNPEEIKSNLIRQLTASVKWTQTMQKMQEDGLTSVTEVGPGKVLQGLFKKMDRALETESAQIL